VILFGSRPEAVGMITASSHVVAALWVVCLHPDGGPAVVSQSHRTVSTTVLLPETKRDGMSLVGVVGVGRIGAPLVTRLIAAGYDVVATDVRHERRFEAEEFGATWTPDVSEAAASCDVVFTVLQGVAELRDLVLGRGDLLSHVDADAIWIDMTSASFELGGELARSASAHGVAYLGAPIGGGVSAMRDGEVVLYVGGDSDVLAAATPILRSFAKSIHKSIKDHLRWELEAGLPIEDQGWSGVYWDTSILCSCLFRHSTTKTLASSCKWSSW
jgi:hypothetical protein